MVIKNFINFDHISKTYKDGTIALSNINFVINKGEFVTILGPSGCGKSTLLKIIGGFEQPTSGRLLVNDIDIKDLSINKRPTATVFQDYALFPNMNVWQNISYGLKSLRKPCNDKPIDVVNRFEKRIYTKFSKIANKKIKVIQKEIQILLRKKIAFLDKVKNDSLYDEILINFTNQKKINLWLKKSIESLQVKMHRSSINNFANSRNIKVLKFSFFNKLKKIIFKIKSKMMLVSKSVSYRANNLNNFQIQALTFYSKYQFNNLIRSHILKINNQLNYLSDRYLHWLDFPLQKTKQVIEFFISKKLSKKEIYDKVKSAVDLVGLKGFESKYPNEISGGMQQRVALARAIVVQPEIILLDEPLSALDAKVKQKMQIELKKLHQQLKITFILVTHDQEEALFLSNKVVVMSKGIIQQINSPKKIYDSPSNLWVANFIGKINVFTGEVVQENVIKFGNISLTFSNLEKKYAIGSLVNLLIRPEDIEISAAQNSQIVGKVVKCNYKGAKFEIFVKWNDLIINVDSLNQYDINAEIGLKLNVNRIHILPYSNMEEDKNV